jgi:hypothetical protein
MLVREITSVYCDSPEKPQIERNLTLELVPCRVTVLLQSVNMWKSDLVSLCRRFLEATAPLISISRNILVLPTAVLVRISHPQLGTDCLQRIEV